MKHNNLNNKTLNIATDQQPPETDPYRKKIANFKKRIIFHLSAFLTIIIIIIAFSFYDTIYQKNNAEQIVNMKTQISDLKIKSADIEIKINNAKKFKQLWIAASSKKKDFSGIKIADVNNNFNSLAKKYDITKPSITISAPKILKNGIYKLQTLDVNLVNFNISFDSLTDESALNFINNFTDSLPGYTIISNLAIKKSRKAGYSKKELVEISNGKFPNLISSKVSFSWYFLKRKPKLN